MIRRMARRLARMVLLALVLIVVLVGAGRWINPPITWLMASEWVRLGSVERQWAPLANMAAIVPLAAMAAEDARFCDHWGFDFAEIEKALAAGASRGASTISQQVAKNVFLWPDRSWLRKGAEVGFTLLIEALWPKRRIIEVYLNVAEFGEGVFGVEAGAKAAFGKSAKHLTARQASRLVAVLPNPKQRRAREQVRTGARILEGANTLRVEGRAACISQ